MGESTRLYRRARRELTAAVDDIVARGRALASSRYERRKPGTLIREARMVRLEANDAVTLAVLAERAAGASWGQVSEALSLDETFAREHYEPIEARWRREHTIAPRLHVVEGQPLQSSG